MLLYNILLLVFISAIYFTTVSFGVFMLAIGRIVLIPFPIVKEKFTLFIKRFWIEITLTYLGIYFSRPITIAYNPNIKDIKRGIVISNHLTDYDWLFLLAILKSFNMYDNNCIILKHSLSKLPVFGYAMKCFGYIFLKREWTEDEQILAEGLDALKDKDEFSLIIFPEGTYIYKESYNATQEYAKKLNFYFDKNPEIKIVGKNTYKKRKYVDAVPDKKYDPRETLFIEPSSDEFAVRNQNSAEIPVRNQNSTEIPAKLTNIIQSDRPGQSEKSFNEYKDEKQTGNTVIDFNNICNNTSERILYNPQNTLIPRRKGFEKITNHLNGHYDGIIDITLFITPYLQFPSNIYTPRNIFIDRDERISFFCIVDCHKTFEDDFLFNTFHQKDLMIGKYGSGECYFNNVHTFAERTYLWKRFGYVYNTVYIWSDYGHQIITGQAILALALFSLIVVYFTEKSK